MLCERCNKVESSILYHEAAPDRSRTLWLCRPCADILSAEGELADVSAAMPPYDSPLLTSDDPPPLPPSAVASVVTAVKEAGGAQDTPPQTVCPLCGLRDTELRETGIVGCALCYRTFRGILSGVLRTLHGSEEHRGRMSADYRAKRERQVKLGNLRESIKEAILAERFEEAAALRDEVRRVEAEMGGL